MGVASAATTGDRNFRLKRGRGGKLSIEDKGGEGALKSIVA
jgi:hypothetical protein